MAARPTRRAQQFRPGMVVEVPAMAFGDAFAAAHVGMTFRGTILGFDVVDDEGSRFWNVRYDDGEYPTKEQDMTIVAIEQLQEEEEEEEEEGGSLPESDAAMSGAPSNEEQSRSEEEEFVADSSDEEEEEEDEEESEAEDEPEPAQESKSEEEFGSDAMDQEGDEEKDSEALEESKAEDEPEAVQEPDAVEAPATPAARQFPAALHAMVTQHSGILSWDAARKAIVVHQPDRIEEVLRRNLRSDKYPSFQRQLNNYGFSKDRGAHVYHHLKPAVADVDDLLRLTPGRAPTSTPAVQEPDGDFELVESKKTKKQKKKAASKAASKASSKGAASTEEDEKDESKLVGGFWYNVVAVFDPVHSCWIAWLIQFKMLIWFMQKNPMSVPLGFMYKHHVGCFVPVAGASWLKTLLATLKLKGATSGKNPVDRWYGKHIGVVAGDIVADCFITLCQWKWKPNIEGLFARLLCSCFDTANEDPKFAGTVTGGDWLLGQLAGRAPFEPVSSLQGLAEKCHADYLGVPGGQSLFEDMKLYDERLIGRHIEMKCVYPRIAGTFGKLEIRFGKLGRNKKENNEELLDIIGRCRAWGGHLSICTRQYFPNNHLKQMFFWGDDLVRGIENLTYYNGGVKPPIYDERPMPSTMLHLQQPAHHIVVRGRNGAPDELLSLQSTGSASSGRKQWHPVKMDGKKVVPTTVLNLDKLERCCNTSNIWADLIEGTPEYVDSQTTAQMRRVWDACTNSSSLMSMRKASTTCNGTARTLHNKGTVSVAEILLALGCKVITECKEEMMIMLPDGRVVTIYTASCSARPRESDGVFFTSIIETGKAIPNEALMMHQVGCTVFVIHFPNELGSRYQCGVRFAAPIPEDRVMFCVIPSNLSKESRQCLMGISVPVSLLYWGLCKLANIVLPENFFDKNPTYNWKGNNELWVAMRDGFTGRADLLRTVRRVVESHADWLEDANPCLFDVEEFCNNLMRGRLVDDVLIQRVRAALSGLGPGGADDVDMALTDADRVTGAAPPTAGGSSSSDDDDDDAPADLPGAPPVRRAVPPTAGGSSSSDDDDDHAPPPPTGGDSSDDDVDAPAALFGADNSTMEEVPSASGPQSPGAPVPPNPRRLGQLFHPSTPSSTPLDMSQLADATPEAEAPNSRTPLQNQGMSMLDKVNRLVEMGFRREDAEFLLRRNRGDLDQTALDLAEVSTPVARRTRGTGRP